MWRYEYGTVEYVASALLGAQERPGGGVSGLLWAGGRGQVRRNSEGRFWLKCWGWCLGVISRGCEGKSPKIEIDRCASGHVGSPAVQGTGVGVLNLLSCVCVAYPVGSA